MSNSSLLHHLLTFFTVLRVRVQELSVLLSALGVCQFMPAFSSQFHSVHSMSIILTYGLAYLFSSLFLESESKNCRFLARHSVCANIMFAFSIHVQATGQELKFCAYFVHSRYKYTPCTPLTLRVPLGSRFALGVRKILHVSFLARNLQFLALRLVCAVYHVPSGSRYLHSVCAKIALRIFFHMQGSFWFLALRLVCAVSQHFMHLTLEFEAC